MPETKHPLEKKIAERMAFLKRVIEFAESITAKRGKQLKYEMHSCHTSVVRELDNFGGFSFRVDLGQSSMGGNTVTVISNDDGSPRRVLTVYWQISVDECDVVFIDKDDAWQKALLSLIEHADTIATASDLSTEESRRKKLEREEHDRYVALLKARAAELKLI